MTMFLTSCFRLHIQADKCIALKIFLPTQELIGQCECRKPSSVHCEFQSVIRDVLIVVQGNIFFINFATEETF